MAGQFEDFLVSVPNSTVTPVDNYQVYGQLWNGGDELDRSEHEPDDDADSAIGSSVSILFPLSTAILTAENSSTTTS